ncbi:MAG TPA: TetR/AcrR family transcriptional regulator [Jiangellaceae bacterium]|nr:TetR/AcrR family transcriptional regulator [Jiangellaceae bacterium]
MFVKEGALGEQRSAGRDPQRTLELLWGAAAPGSRGPRPSLTLARVVDTAVAVADAEGLAAVSMRRVADELGVTTMSLYRYVPSKDSLLELMQDAGSGAPPEARDPPGPWRTELERWARSQKAVYRARPWLLHVPLAGPPMGPNSLGWMESALASLQDTGLGPDDMLFVLLLVTVYVRGEAQLGFGIAEAAERTGVSAQERDEVYANMMQSLLSSGRYPALARITAAGVFELAEQDPDADFEFGLSRILDGVQALVDARGSDGQPAGGERAN